MIDTTLRDRAILVQRRALERGERLNDGEAVARAQAELEAEHEAARHQGKDATS